MLPGPQSVMPQLEFLTAPPAPALQLPSQVWRKPPERQQPVQASLQFLPERPESSQTLLQAS